MLCELTAISLRLSETTVCRSVNRWKQLQWAFHMILQLKLSQSTSIYFWSMMLTAVGGVSVILISVCVCFSSALSVYLSSSHDGSRLCEFSITQYACADVRETHCSQTCEHTLRLCKHVFSVCVCVCVCVFVFSWQIWAHSTWRRCCHAVSAGMRTCPRRRGSSSRRRSTLCWVQRLTCSPTRYTTAHSPQDASTSIQHIKI